MPDFDLMVKGGLVVDGTGTQRYRADIGIRAGKVTRIGRLDASDAGRVLDSVDRRRKAVNVLPYVPLAPLLVWVMGFDRAKAGELPTDAEHAELRRLLNEAMDAGGCGWSAQRLHPDGPGAVQRDYDGGPMVTDLMHDATALHLAEVLAERNQGFMQMALATADGAHDFAHIEHLAEVSGRPLLYNVVQSFVRLPEAHRALIAWLDGCRQRG